MRKFFSSLLASILGTAIVLGLFLIIPLCVLIASASSSQKQVTKVNDHSIFHLKLDGPIVEYSPINPFENLDIPFLNSNTKTGLSNILAAINEAKQNKKIEGIYLDLIAPETGYGTMEEIRDALIDFKTSGKFVVAYADSYSQKAYYLASCATKLFINPQGMLELKGLAAQKMFYKDLIEKLDIQVQIAKVGTYKSYVEQYSRKDISPESRSQDLLWMNDLWDHVANQIAQSRGISRQAIEEDVKNIVFLQDAPSYIQEKLVDSLLYRNQVSHYINEMCGMEGDDKAESLSLLAMSNIKRADTKKNIVGVIYCEGEIGSSKGITYKKFAKNIKNLREDDQVKAIVVRVNSPGGSAYESEQIWNEIKLTEKKKPVVISMGDVAASGGYYMSSGADAIVAHNTTITGSIGIFGLMPSFGGLAKKLGITFDVVKTHQYADVPNGIDPMTDTEMAQFQKYVERGYALFTKRCSEGRKIAKDSLEHIAQGRVWTGAQGIQKGLVDQIGGISKAVSIAAEKANLTEYKMENYPKNEKFFEEIIKSISGKDDVLLSSKTLESFKPYLDVITDTQNMKGIQARLPYNLILK